MVVNKQLSEQLKKEFNLNIYEVKIWTALLSRGISTAGELADISGVPRSRCYDVLESLEKKSFIIMKIGKPIKYIAVDPNEILERVKREVSAESQRTIVMLEKIREDDVFDELNLLYKTGIEHFDSADLSSAVKGKADINFQIKNMVKNAKKSVTIGTTKDSFNRNINLVKNAAPLLKKKGIKLQIVGPYDSKIAKKLNGFAKFTDRDHGLRFVEVDNEQLFFMTTDETLQNENEAGIWVKSPFFINTFSRLFDGMMK